MNGKKLGFTLLCTLLFCTINSFARIDHTADSDTIALYHLEETAAQDGNDVFDAGSFGNDSRVINDGINFMPVTVDLNVSGVSGSGVHISTNENRAYVECMSINSNEWLGGDFTFEMWVKNVGSLAGADPTYFGSLLALQRNAIIEWSLGLNSDGGFKLTVNNLADKYSTSALAWPTGVWFHVVLVADTNGVGVGVDEARYSLYRTAENSRELDLIDSVVLSKTAIPGAASNLRIGRSETDVTRQVDFLADEIHYSRIARSESYLAQHAALDTGSFEVEHLPDSDTTLLWHFEETASVAGNDTSDSGWWNHDGRAVKDGIDFTPQSVDLNIAGISGSGVKFTGDTEETKIDVTISKSSWPGRDFTLEMWVKDVGPLAGAESTYLGRVLAIQRSGSGHLDWSLGLQANGGFHLYVGATPTDIYKTAGLTWTPGTWYYIALVVDSNGTGAGAGESLFSFYRRKKGDETMTLIDSVVLAEPIILTDTALFHVDYSDGNDATRRLNFTADEVHYSRVARSVTYLESYSVIQPKGTVIVVE